MRTIVGVGLLLLCAVLSGCSLFRDKRSDTAKGDAPSGSRPFTGTPTSRLPERADRQDTATAPSDYSGVLAGYVLDRFNRPMNNAFIQVVDLNDADGKSKLDVAADSRGQFAIPRLTAGHTYKLTARVKDGTRFMAGSYQATAPNPKIALIVSEDLVDKDTPPLPGPLGLPGKTPEPTEKEKDKESKPAAGLGTPIRVDPASETGTSIQPPVVLPPGPVDRTNIVKEEEKGGFKRSPPVMIQSPPEPKDPLPPPPRIPGTAEDQRAPLGAPMTPKSESESTTSVPGTPTPVPSCVLIGKKLEDFALFDLEGKPWEFRKERKGKLVLLQFWSSTSPECLVGLRNIRDLQAKYDSFGLQVIGIAYEQGSWVQQVQNVRSARGRHVLNYVTLLGGGGQGSCPVRDQFVVDTLPELVLLGEDGTIIWRTRGNPDADRLVELRLIITRRLRINEP